MYIPVPPDTVIVAIPSACPQLASLCVSDNIIAVGSSIVVFPVWVQPLLSVTTTLNNPGHKPAATALVCASGSSHK